MYTRWGSRSCPDNEETELMYSGVMGANEHEAHGGGANFLCMPKNPEYSSNLTYQPGVRGVLFLTAATYSVPFRRDSNGHQVACTVCYVKNKSLTLMIPARASCPSPWTRQYYGYIMSEQRGGNSRNRYMYECVDKATEIVHGPNNRNFGLAIFPVEASCNRGLNCGADKYNNHQEINCVVCAK